MTRREEIAEALYNLIVDHPMWIDGQGQGLDYSPERESRIGDFLDEAAATVDRLCDEAAADALDGLNPLQYCNTERGKSDDWDNGWVEAMNAIDETAYVRASALRAAHPTTSEENRRG